jgi:hypothetical protein
LPRRGNKNTYKLLEYFTGRDACATEGIGAIGKSERKTGILTSGFALLRMVRRGKVEVTERAGSEPARL